MDLLRQLDGHWDQSRILVAEGVMQLAVGNICH